MAQVPGSSAMVFPYEPAALVLSARPQYTIDRHRHCGARKRYGFRRVPGVTGLVAVATMAALVSGLSFTRVLLTRGGCNGRDCIRTLSGKMVAVAATSGSEDAGFDPLDMGTEGAQGNDASEVESGDPSALQTQLRVQALSGPGSFILEMGGQRLLINPMLDEGSQIRPEKVHTEFDYVILTSGKKEFFHAATLEQMSLMRVNFIASQKAAELLSNMMLRNMAVLAPGPEGRTALTGSPGTAPIAVMVTPGANAPLMWETPESGFIFVNLETGVAVGFEASGQYCGPNAASTVDGIPEAAYQIDYLITPDLRSTSGVVKGLADKGAALRAVVRLPGLKTETEIAEETNPMFAPFLALDRGVDAALGGIGDDPAEFQSWLSKQGAPLSDIVLLAPAADAEAVDLDGAA